MISSSNTTFQRHLLFETLTLSPNGGNFEENKMLGENLRRTGEKFGKKKKRRNNRRGKRKRRKKKKMSNNFQLWKVRVKEKEVSFLLLEDVMMITFLQDWMKIKKQDKGEKERKNKKGRERKREKRKERG